MGPLGEGSSHHSAVIAPFALRQLPPARGLLVIPELVRDSIIVLACGRRGEQFDEGIGGGTRCRSLDVGLGSDLVHAGLQVVDPDQRGVGSTAPHQQAMTPRVPLLGQLLFVGRNFVCEMEAFRDPTRVLGVLVLQLHMRHKLYLAQTPQCVLEDAFEAPGVDAILQWSQRHDITGMFHLGHPLFSGCRMALGDFVQDQSLAQRMQSFSTNKNLRFQFMKSKKLQMLCALKPKTKSP